MIERRKYITDKELKMLNRMFDAEIDHGLGVLRSPYEFNQNTTMHDLHEKGLIRSIRFKDGRGSFHGWMLTDSGCLTCCASRWEHD